MPRPSAAMLEDPGDIGCAASGEDAWDPLGRGCGPSVGICSHRHAPPHASPCRAKSGSRSQFLQLIASDGVRGCSGVVRGEPEAKWSCRSGQPWLLQGPTVRQRCGYAYYGKTAPRSRTYDPMNTLRYYRCTGADGHRFNGKAVCNNGPVRSDQLEGVVWDQVRALLEEPHRMADEYRRRIAQARDGAAIPDDIAHLDRQMTSLRRGISRLIDSYTESVIDKAEFEPRIAGLKLRVSQLQDRHQAALEMAESERDLTLVISRLEDFSAKVTTGLDNLDQLGMQDIIRAVVRRIEIDDSRIEVIFRVPSPDGPPGPRTPSRTPGPWQHCTGVGRAVLRLDRAQSAPGKGLRGHHQLGARIPLRRLRHASRPPNCSRLMTFETDSKA